MRSFEQEKWIARKMAFCSLCRFQARHEMGPESVD